MKTVYHFGDCKNNPCICLKDQKELKKGHEQIIKTYEKYIGDYLKQALYWKKQLQKLKKGKLNKGVIHHNQ